MSVNTSVTVPEGCSTIPQPTITSAAAEAKRSEALAFRRKIAPPRAVVPLKLRTTVP